jgi:lambda family phage tail tape measure protein
MATAQYNINVSTTSAVQNLQNLQSKLQSTNQAFSGLKDAVIGFASAAFIGNLYGMANELSDSAKAAGISTQALLGFSRAVEQNGGSMEKAAAGMANFSQSIDSAAKGSKTAQDNFLELGISLTDLRTLSEEDLLARVVQGLGNITDVSKRAAIGVDIFGKAFKGVDARGVASDIDALTKAAAGSAGAVDAAGKASQNFKSAYSQLQTELLKALQPLSELAAGMLQMTAILQPLIQAVIGFGGSWLIFAKVIPNVQSGLAAIAISLAASGGIMGAMKNAIMGVVAGFTAFGVNLARVVGLSTTAYGGVTSLTFAFSGLLRGLLRFAGIAGVLYTIYEVVNSITKSITGSSIYEWGEKVAKSFGLISQTSTEAAAAEAKNKATTDALAKSKEELAKANRAVEDAMKAEKAALTQLFTAYQASNAEALSKMKNDTALMTMSEEKAAQFTAELESYGRYVEQYKKLKADYDKAANSASASERATAPLINEGIKKLTEEYKKNLPAVEAAASAQVREAQAKRFSAFESTNLASSQQRLGDIQNEIAKVFLPELEKKYADVGRASRAAAESAIAEEEARRNQKLDPSEKQKYYEAAAQAVQKEKDALKELNAQQEANNLLQFGLKQQISLNNDINKVLDEQAKLGLTSIEQKYYDIEVAARASAQAEIDAYRVRNGVEMPIDQQEEYFKKGREGSDRLKRANEGLYNQSRLFSTGWKQAMNEYAENAGNAAQRAKDLFNKAVNGMTDVFVNFAMTGKFEWKKFVASMAEELLRSQITSIFGQMMSSMSGSMSKAKFTEGSSSFVGPLMSGGGIGGGGGDFLGSVISTIGDFFGGFFATGGTIPKGKFGVVGERGPEFVRGPANVSPMGGGSVTYNINAVDAMSFKALIAQDPGFIHAVAQQGAQGIAGRR